MADDELDVVGVLRNHLEEIHAALSNARTREEAADLADALRQGKHGVKPSWISRELNRSIVHVEGYLSVTLEDHDDVSPK